LELKTERQGRVFPVSDDSRLVASILERSLAKSNVKTIFTARVLKIEKRKIASSAFGETRNDMGGMDKRPLGVISVFFIIGIVLGRFLPDSVTLFNVFIVTLILLTLTLALSHKWERGAHGFLFLSIISLGSLLYLNSNIFPPNHISHTFAPIAIGAQYSAQRTPSFSSGGLHFLGKDKIKAEITGVIKRPAEARGVYYGKVRSRYVFEVEAIKEHSAERIEHSGKAEKNGWVKVKGLALVKIQTEKDYQYGDRLLVKGTIKKPGSRSLTRSSLKLAPLLQHSLKSEPKTNFNYKQYLENQNIFAIINASEKNVTLLAHNYKINPILKYAYLVREKLKNLFLEKMPLESGAFLRAILLGDRSELPKKLNESFRNSGTMHILPTQCRGKHNYPS
jgi:hypothetical protein